jgi:hypothetical protein
LNRHRLPRRIASPEYATVATCVSNLPVLLPSEAPVFSQQPARRPVEFGDILQEGQRLA